MSKEYKRSMKFYAAWSYQKEIEDLNKMSREGWQLVKGGCFHSKFKRNTDICYRYQLDYNAKIDEMGRYIETFREQGWEYVNSTGNGWHYFRKPYDPKLPEAQYEIFSDQESLQEMLGRWKKASAAFAIVCGIFSILFATVFFIIPQLPYLISTLIQLSACLFSLRGLFLMRNPEKMVKKRFEGLNFALYLLTLIAGVAVMFCSFTYRPYFSIINLSEEAAPISANIEEAVEWTTLDIRYRDNYYMDLDVEADSSLCFVILSSDGEEVYKICGADIEEESIRLHLDKGTYSIVLYDFSGGRMEVNCEIN